jgi:hypothetical protein
LKRKFRARAVLMSAISGHETQAHQSEQLSKYACAYTALVSSQDQANVVPTAMYTNFHSLGQIFETQICLSFQFYYRKN